MNTTLLSQLKDFANPYYQHKDEMHGLAHIERILSGARDLAEGNTTDDDLLVFGAYFHGLIGNDEAAIREFLPSLGLDDDRIALIVKIAWESGKSAQPETNEGALLHDAHLIEGGKYFHITKSLVTGTLRGQTLTETVDYVEENILGEFRCVTPKAQSTYIEIEKFARDFVTALRTSLKL
jgi:uncharacterized protein